MWVYLSRITPILTWLSLLGLCTYCFIYEPLSKKANETSHRATTPRQWILAIYTLILHLLSLQFPLRLMFALQSLTARIAEHVESVDEENEARNWSANVSFERKTIAMPSHVFVIIIPSYEETMGTLQDTLRVLASHPQAGYQYHVYLAMEEAEDKAAAKASGLVIEFTDSFFRMSCTIHPSGTPGEARGKSSNESWAAKQACRDYPSQIEKRMVVITVMDADSHLSPRYFTQISMARRCQPGYNQSTIYMPPIVFDRNLHRAPLLVRMADIMWASAGISSMYSSSSISIPTSVYSIPMPLVEHVQGWDCDATAIGEDLHMFLKCFFALSGNLRMQVIYAAASQCNVGSRYAGLRGYAGGLLARYQQGVRHMWGALDTGYAIRQSCLMFSRSPRRAMSQTTGSSNSLYPTSKPACLPSSRLNNNHDYDADVDTDDETTSTFPEFVPRPTNKLCAALLYFRLFEAHLMPLHLALFLTTSTIYSFLYPRFLIPQPLRLVLSLCSYLRLLGFAAMLFSFSRYERYHRLCVGLRKEEMRKAGLLERMVQRDDFSPNVFLHAGIAEAALFAVSGILFGAVPALQAEVSHLFTTRLTYVVSWKP